MSIESVESSVVEMKPEDALKYLQAYRKSFKDTSRKTDQMLVKAMRFASKGKKIFDMHQVMLKAGVDENKRPRLAVARADWSHAYYRSEYRGSGVFQRESFISSWQTVSCVRLPENTFGEGLGRDGVAVVPHIPPDIRPIDDLKNYWILFEPEWKDIPRDPYLLKRIESSLLFVVLAQWDLTPLERMVMRATVSIRQ